MAKRATLEELKDFANKVRKAGGGNPIDALMPSVPEDTQQCLIARNLNFNCEVDAAGRGYSDDTWKMTLSDRETRDKIAEELHLAKRNSDDGYSVLLPKKIGQCAADFDRAMAIITNIEGNISNEYAPTNDISTADIELVKEMWPYIEESEKEAYDLASIINDDGSIVL